VWLSFNSISQTKSSSLPLSGNENEKELELLAEDIFLYFGLGCRNISKLYLPENYNFEKLIKVFQKYNQLGNHNKYCNNYDYNKTIFAMKKLGFIDGGFFILKNSDNLASPISVINFEYYNNLETVINNLDTISEQLQCKTGNHKKLISFGLSQKPDLWDYADNIDTLKFISQL